MPEEGPPRSGYTRLACVAIGIVAALLAYALLPGAGHADLTPQGRLAICVGVVMAVWWMTEAIPLEATGLVPLIAFPLLGVTTFKQAAAPYSEDIIALFLGGMVLGVALEHWGVHRRVAYGVILAMGASPSRLVASFIVCAAFFSMWVSNTAATVMMLPIAASVAAIVTDRCTKSGADAHARAGNVAPCLVLAIAFAATVGGVGTVIGTPPVAQFAGYMRGTHGVPVTFASWLPIGLPVVACVLPIIWVVLTRLVFPLPRGTVPGVREHIREQQRELGPWSLGERLTVIVFLLAAGLWVCVPLLRGVPLIRDSAAGPVLARTSDGTIALGAAMLLFILPVSPSRGLCVLSWREAARVPWGILILFGGGLSLAATLTATGVDAYIASLAGPLQGMPVIAVLLLFSGAALVLTEFTSNTALVAAALPVAGAISQKIGIPPVLLLATVTLAASLGFMLPGGTAPNALVFASGQVSMRQMMKAGLRLDIACGLGVPFVVYAAWRVGLLPH